MKKLLLSPVTAFLINIFPIVIFYAAYLIDPNDWAIESTGLAMLRFRISDLLYTIWVLSILGGLFHLMGVILSISYLCRRGKTLSGVIISVISIIFPFVYWFILITFEIIDLRMLP